LEDGSSKCFRGERPYFSSSYFTEKANRLFGDGTNLECEYATMPAYSWQKGELTLGIDTSRSTTGVAGLHQRESQQWTRYVFLGAGGRIEEAAVIRLSEEKWQGTYGLSSVPATTTVVGLAQVETPERQTNAALIRVNLGRIGSVFHHDWKAHRGNPRLLGYGWNGHREAPDWPPPGWINRLFWDEALFVIHEGDVLWVKAGESQPVHAITMSNGQVRSELWISWEAKDARRDPQSYVSKGIAPFGHVPLDWIEELAQREAARKAAEEARAAEKRRLAEELAKTFGGYFRRMGRAGNSDYWVVRPDGTLRDPDEVQYRKRYTSEGEKRWRLVGPDELAISWEKGDTSSSHEFRVNHLPVDGCTDDQLATVERIEREIEANWEGAVGMSSGKTSPSIGDGWSLKKNPEPSNGLPLSGAELGSAIDALRARFGKK
jgi:hypothetical protein